MSRTRIFDHYADAKTAVSALEHAGIEGRAISLIGRGGEDLGTLTDYIPVPAVTAVGRTALDNLGLIVITGIGPLAVAGPLATRIVINGSTGTALLSALVATGHDERSAHILAEAIHRGASLVSVIADRELEAGIDALVAAHNGVPVDVRGDAYAEEGWTHYDPAAAPLTSEQVYEERMRYSEAA